jgi:hypothetical protein
MPGIQISTAVRTGPANTTIRETSQAFFVGQALRGPVDEALLVTSLEDFELKYGGYTSGSFLHPTVESFFEEGGTRCYISRVTNTSGTATATSLLKNDAVSPVTSITLTANGPGASANSLKVAVAAGNVTNSRVVSISDGTTLLMSTGSCTTNAQICGKINTHPLVSQLITATDAELASSSLIVSTTGTIGTVTGASAPYTATITAMDANSTANLTVGQAITATAGSPGSFGAGTMTVVSIASTTSITVSSTATFTAGTVTNIVGVAGTSGFYVLPDTFSVRSFGPAGGSLGTEGSDGTTSPGANEYASALDDFLDAYGAGAVACPESPATYSGGVLDAFTSALIAHCNAKSRIAIVHAAKATTSSADLGDIAEGIQISENAEHIAMYAPWVSAPTGTNGVNRFIPPTGYVAGSRSRAHNQIGPHQPGAGIISNARFINGVYASYDSTVGNELDASAVNAIRVINNVVRIYGARSLSLDTANFRYINAQDVVNHVVVEANRTLEDVLFTVIDGRNSVFATIEAKLVSVMEPLRTLGALYEAFDVNGRRIDYGYTVKCDNSLNPLAQLVDGTVTARVGLRVSSIGDSIQVDIIKSNLTTSVV